MTLGRNLQPTTISFNALISACAWVTSSMVGLLALAALVQFKTDVAGRGICCESASVACCGSCKVTRATSGSKPCTFSSKACGNTGSRQLGEY